jgi:hypothetical protein
MDTEGRVRSYFRTSFANGFNRLLQQRKREVLAEPPPPKRAAGEEPAEIFAREVLDLLDRMLEGFEDWGNERSPGSGTRNLESLYELEWATRDRIGTREITQRLQPDLSGDALRKAAATRGKAWRRARERFHEYSLDFRFRGKDERDLRPEVLRAFDARFRIRRKSTVRNPGHGRRNGNNGSSR